MSCIASAVSRWIASGATRRKVCPSASKVETPSVVISRYGVSSGPIGSRSEYRNSGSVATNVEYRPSDYPDRMPGDLESSNQWGDPSRLRISDADRHRVGEVLREAAGEGRLDIEELEERLEAAYAAKTYGDLVPLTADLPVALPEGARPP